MGRYVPKTYNNRRILRIIYRLIITVILVAVTLFILLFFGLRQYEVHTEDGIKLEIPFLMDNPPSDGQDTQSALLGFVLGVITAVIQLRLYSAIKAHFAEGKPDRKTILILAAQLLAPLILLVIAALLLRGDIVWAVIGVAATVIGVSFFRFIRSGRRNR